MFPIRRFYTPHSSKNETSSLQPGSLSSGLGSRLGGLAGSTYERVGEEHHPHAMQHHHHHPSIDHHRPLSTEPDETDEDEPNAEQAAAAMGDLGPDGLPIVPLKEKVKFYTSLCFGTTAILAVFAFLFLIPFIVDPAISSLAADFEQQPVTCVVSSFETAIGLKNCTWSSCREGCTTAALKCTLIKVNYSRTPFDEARQGRGGNSLQLDFNVTDTKFFVNTEGCGYPPKVNCSEFARKYRLLGDAHFPCYFSRTYPELVVAEYSWDKTVRNLVLALVAPPVVFGITVGTLIFWYCPGCSKEKADETGDGEELQVEDEVY
ncbi:Hypothetical predicted protein [Cloeon dipterum]|uniref:Protein tipE n=1 Tax=Cloeon dipterum TaxID=197152 RepID=A0A8S1D3F6_9INSE|nr:Hypothetical predicted protein [Cloeon dipterum]